MKTYTEKEISALQTFYNDEAGTTEVSVRKAGAKKILRIADIGSMGFPTNDDLGGGKKLDANLKRICFPSIKELKKKFDVVKEDGNPDNAYTLDLDITEPKVAEALISEPGDDKMVKPPKKTMNETRLRKIVSEQLKVLILKEGPSRRPGHETNEYSGDKWQNWLTPEGNALWDLLSSGRFEEFYKNEVEDLITGSDRDWDDDRYNEAIEMFNLYGARIKKAVKASGKGKHGM